MTLLRQASIKKPFFKQIKTPLMRGLLFQMRYDNIGLWQIWQ